MLVEPALRATYEADWTRRYTGRARLVVRPATRDQVAGVLRECASRDAPVVVQGGNTGLVGGAVPNDGDVVLSTTRLRTLGAVDPLSRQVTAGAGVTLATLAHHVEAAGLEVALDLASRDSATVGGIVATNAGGVRASRHGSARAQLVGVEAVLPTGGTVGSLSAVSKDNTGYHWPSLLAGSEGTLGVITAARFRLIPRPERRVVVLLGLPSTDAAVRVSVSLSPILAVGAVELFYDDGLGLVRKHRSLAAPFVTPWPVYVLVEAAGKSADVDDAVDKIASLSERSDAAVGLDESTRARLWELREAHSEAIALEGIPHKLDVAVPLDRLARFEAEVRALVSSLDPRSRTIIWGHLGDGNLHVNVLGPDVDDDGVDDGVLQLVASHGGSISSEHGIGRMKAHWLALTRSEADIAAMRAIKGALDPTWLLNRGVLFSEFRR